MEDEQQARWRRIMEASTAGHPACQLHLARQYARLYPRDVAGLCALADVLNDMRRYSDARSALCTAFRIATRHGVRVGTARDRTDFIYSQVGLMYEHMGDHRRAEMWFGRAVRFSASTHNLVFLGTCVLRQERFQEAECLLRRAVATESSKLDEAYYDLGITLRNTGRNDEALECFERAIELDPDYEMAKGARDDILQLQKIGNGIQPLRATGAAVNGDGDE